MAVEEDCHQHDN